MKPDGIKLKPEEIFGEYRAGVGFKESIGTHGIYEQTKMNERFFVGDQWYGVKAGNTRPLIRRNLIKRIGEYKMSVITAAPVAVNFTADGVPCMKENTELREIGAEMINGRIPDGEPDPAEISVICGALSDYFRVTAERVRFDTKKEELLRNAFISGTGIAYTYWDPDCVTGQYVDDEHTMPIKGDIGFEVLDVENVNFGDPNCDNIEQQPFIIIAQRLQAEDVRREAENNGLPTDKIKPDGADSFGMNSGDRGSNEPTDSRRITVLTKLYRKYEKDGNRKIWAVRVTEKATVRKPWSLGISRYPISKFCWERRRSSAYGDSEITYLIPNQIAINRALSAAFHGIMCNGMPIMMVNGDVIPDEISNDPGQVIRAYGTGEDISSAIRYVAPPTFAAQYENLVNDLAAGTFSDSGANDAALGNLRMDNASAIIQLREAATAPMQIYMNRFYDFIEDTARIWAEMWLTYYGDRDLKLEDKKGVSYIPFKAERYKSLSLTARIDVGASTLWGEAAVVGTLDNLLRLQIITPLQYLERLPKGLIPNLTGLMREITEQQQTSESQELPENQNAEEQGYNETATAALERLRELYPEQYEKLQQMNRRQQNELMSRFNSMEEV